MSAIAKLLAASAVLTWLMLLVASLMRSRGWTIPGMIVAFGNRDTMPEADAATGRAERAARNMVENLAVFAALLLAAMLAQVPTDRLLLPSQLFFWARVAYWPTYLVGIPYLRTAIWTVSVIGLAMIAAAVLGY